jgi:hypothetical protein
MRSAVRRGRFAPFPTGVLLPVFNLDMAFPAASSHTPAHIARPATSSRQRVECGSLLPLFPVSSNGPAVTWSQGLNARPSPLISAWGSSRRAVSQSPGCAWGSRPSRSLDRASRSTPSPHPPIAPSQSHPVLPSPRPRPPVS